MRLKQEEIVKIKKIIEKFFGESKIYIFGSRLDEEKRGGDIDIFIIPKNSNELNKKSAKVKFLLENALLKPIDILLNSDFNREIEKEALKGAEL